MTVIIRANKKLMDRRRIKLQDIMDAVSGIKLITVIQKEKYYSDVDSSVKQLIEKELDKGAVLEEGKVLLIQQ